MEERYDSLAVVEQLSRVGMFNTDRWCNSQRLSVITPTTF